MIHVLLGMPCVSILLNIQTVKQHSSLQRVWGKKWAKDDQYYGHITKSRLQEMKVKVQQCHNSERMAGM